MACRSGLSSFVSVRSMLVELERRLQVDSADPAVAEADWAVGEAIAEGRAELDATVALIREALEFLDVDAVERDELVYRRRDLVRRVRRLVEG